MALYQIKILFSSTDTLDTGTRISYFDFFVLSNAFINIEGK